MRLDRDSSLGGADVGAESLRAPERDSGTYSKVDGVSGTAEEPPAIQLDENAKLRASVGECIDKLASLSETFFLVLHRYTIEQQRAIDCCLGQQENLHAKRVLTNQKLAECTFSFGFFKLTSTKGKKVAGDLEKLNQSVAAIKNALVILNQPIRSQIEVADTLSDSLNDQQFRQVADELKAVYDEIAVLLQVCLHLYAQLNTTGAVNSKRGKVGVDTDMWTDLHMGRIQLVSFEQFLRVVYLFSTQNRHIPASRKNVKVLLLDQLSTLISTDLSTQFDDDEYIADNLMWTLFQAWNEPVKHKQVR